MLPRKIPQSVNVILKAAGRVPAGLTARMAVLLALAIAPISSFGAAKNPPCRRS